MQTFFNTLKDNQPKEDNSKLLDSLSKAAQGSGDSSTGFASIGDSIVKAVDDDAKTQISQVEMIGKAAMKTGAPVQQRSQGTNQTASTGDNFSRNPLNNLMGLSGKPGGGGSTSTGQPNLGSMHPGSSRAIAGQAYNPPN